MLTNSEMMSHQSWKSRKTCPDYTNLCNKTHFFRLIFQTFNFKSLPFLSYLTQEIVIYLFHSSLRWKMAQLKYVKNSPRQTKPKINDIQVKLVDLKKKIKISRAFLRDIGPQRSKIGPNNKLSNKMPRESNNVTIPHDFEL